MPWHRSGAALLGRRAAAAVLGGGVVASVGAGVAVGGDDRERGEVLGLEWPDLDVARRRLSVRRSVSCTGYEVHVSATKTRASRRTIDLDDRTIELLVEWRDRQAAELGSTLASVVFTRPNGCRVHPHLVSQTFDRIQRRVEVPRIRFHDLRHTHATIGLRAGVPVKVMSERLGHSTPAFTLQQYAHVIPGMQAEAAEAIASIVAEHRPGADDLSTCNDDADDRDDEEEVDDD